MPGKCFAFEEDEQCFLQGLMQQNMYLNFKLLTSTFLFIGIDCFPAVCLPNALQNNPALLVSLYRDSEYRVLASSLKGTDLNDCSPSVGILA